MQKFFQLLMLEMVIGRSNWLKKVVTWQHLTHPLEDTDGRDCHSVYVLQEKNTKEEW